MPITITRRFEFDAAHRVLHHESKCKHLHGHRYRAELTMTSPELDGLGRVIDFGVVKQIIVKFIDEYLDHNILLHPADPLVGLLHVLDSRQFSIPTMEMGAPKIEKWGSWNAKVPWTTMVINRETITGGKAPFIMPCSSTGGMNPTAENLANVLYHQWICLLPENISLTKVRLYETPNCWADYQPSLK